MIFTFYSYKGGVGRSMALANVAACYQAAGLRVALIDWDLEAPGIESYFVQDANALTEIRSSVGLIDVLSSYRRKFPHLEFPSPEGSAAGSASQRLELDIQALDEQLPPLTHALYPLRTTDNSALWLLHAGWRTGARFKSYAETVQGFDWADFYTTYRGEVYFEWMRRQLLREGVADVVLIDSRTGVTEMGGVCTRQLADVVVCFSVMNHQNLQGSTQMAASFSRTDLMQRRGRPLQSVFVPARVDSFNTTLKNELQKEFNQRFSPYTPGVFRALGAQFWDLRVPYISDYAYRERLAVGDPQADKDLEESYRKLAAHLVMLTPRASRARARYAPEIKRIFGNQLPDILVVYQDDSLREDALEIVQRLQADALSVWNEPANVPAGATPELHSAVSQARLVLALASEGSGRAWLRSVWWAAREQGVTLLPLRREGQSAVDEAGLPNWMRRVPALTLPGQWPELLEQLRKPHIPPRLLAMAPPSATNVVRRHEADLLVEELLRAAKAPQPETIVLWGLTGSGKTTMVASVCSDERVQDAYPDGVMWITLGPEPNIEAELSRCLLACGRTPNPRAGLAELRREVELQLKGRQCLLVIDEACDVEHLQGLLLASAGSVHVVTTRFRNLAYAVDTSPFVVGDLSSDDARSVLTHRVQSVPPSGGTAELLRSLIEKVGGSPLAVNSLNRELQRRTDQGQPLKSALSEIAAKLEEVGLRAIDPVGSPGGPSIEARIASTLERLSEQDRALMLYLADGDPSERPRRTLDDLATRLGRTAADLRPWIEGLADAALIEFDRALGTVALHPLISLFVTKLSPSNRDAPMSERPSGAVWTGATSLPPAPAPAAASPATAPPPAPSGAPSASPGERRTAAGAPGAELFAAVSELPGAPDVSAAQAKPRRRWLAPTMGAAALVLTVVLTWLATMTMGALEPPVGAPSPATPATEAPTTRSARVTSGAQNVDARLAEQHVRFAEQALASGEQQTAFEQYQRAVALDPSQPSAWFGLGQTQLALGRLEDAARSFGEVLAAASTDARGGRPSSSTPPDLQLIVMSHLGRATVYSERYQSGSGPLDLQQGDGKLALAELDAALELDSHNALVHLGRGLLFERAKRTTDALNAYSRAIELDGELAEAHFRRGCVAQELMLQADPKRSAEARRAAIADFRKVVSMSSAEPRRAMAARARLEQLGARGAQRQSRGAVYIQYASSADQRVINQLRKELEARGFDVPPPELLEERVSSAILRYFFPDDSDEAQLIRASVESSLASEGFDLPVPVQYRSIAQYPSATPQRLELWLPALGEPRGHLINMRWRPM